MKKIIVFTALIIGGLFLATHQAVAQDGSIKVGGGLIFGSGVYNGGSDLNNDLGLRINGYYTINEQFRAGADIGYFFPKKQNGVTANFWELDLNGNYFFYNDSDNGASAYALAGLNYMNLKLDYDSSSQYGSFSGSASDSQAGLNLGVGGEYAVNFGVLYAELKYVLSDADELVLGAGVRFPIN